MAGINCGACEELRQKSSEFVVNGITDDICSSLANNTGLVPSSGHDTCTDLENLNDCLIGNMENEIDAYEVCDWKEFMKNFISNLWTTLKAMICAICGLWKHIQGYTDSIERLECLVDALYEGVDVKVGEEPTGDTFVVAGKGVSFYETGQTDLSGDITLQSFGGMGLWGGSVIIHHKDFKDAKASPNFDTNSLHTTKDRKGNTVWGDAGKPSGGSELLYEIRVKNSAYPQIGGLSSGRGMNATGGSFHCLFSVFREGRYAHGLHGQCHPTDGTPSNSNSSKGHLVPQGWTYFQCRITYLDKAIGDGNQISPKGWFGIKLQKNKVEC